MADFLEELDFDLEDLELIKKMSGGIGHKFPNVCVGTRTVYFSKKAAPYVPDYYKWFVNGTWAVLKPCPKDDKNAYRIHRHVGGVGATGRFPSELSDNTLMRGLHKLYKTKDGVAFKRYVFADEKGEEYESA